MALIATSYVPTGGATATRNADVLPFPFLARPQAMTIYVRFVELGTAFTGTTTGLLAISADTEAAPLFRIRRSANGTYIVEHETAGGTVSASVSGISIGDVVELRATLSATGTVQLHVSINGAAESSSSESAALTLATAWSGQKLFLNARDLNTTTLIGFNAFRNVIFHRGVQSLVTMRRLALV